MQSTRSSRLVCLCALWMCVPLASACQRAVGDGTHKPTGSRPRSVGSSMQQSDASIGDAADGGGGHGGARAQAGSGGTAGRGGMDDDDAGSIVIVSDAGGVIPPDSSSCGVDVSVTTANGGGTYAPSNIGVLWVATGSGTFVKTLALWADRRIEQLHGWTDASTAAGQPQSMVDAITSATANLAGPRSAHWDCDDTRGKRMPDGDYQICFELTESDKAGPLDCVVFSKSAKTAQLMPADTKVFKQRALVFTP